MKAFKLAVAALMVLAAPAYLTVAHTYDVTAEMSGSIAGVSEQDPLATGYRYEVDPGDVIEVAVTVHNPGKLDVTFTGAVLEYYGYFDLQRVSMIQSPGSGPAVPFHAVAIRPGEQLLLRLTLQVSRTIDQSDCFRIGFGMRMRYTVMGLERDEPVAMPSGISFGWPCSAAQT